jgi:hypothetical protein
VKEPELADGLDKQAICTGREPPPTVPPRGAFLPGGGLKLTVTGESAQTLAVINGASTTDKDKKTDIILQEDVVMIINFVKILNLV